MNESRRFFMLAALTGLAGAASIAFAPALADAALPLHSATDVLRAVANAPGYHAAGPETGRPIVLARSHDQSIEQHAETAALLAAQGFQVLLPHLRDAAPQTLGQDLIDFIDKLHMPEAVFVGTGDAAHAAKATTHIRRTRVVGLVLAGPDARRAADAAAVPTLALPADATAEQIADAAATLARQGKWRT